MIPNQLKDCKFCRVRHKTKKPFEADWTKKHYSYDEISQHFPKENYGVLTGLNNLGVLDDDTKDGTLVNLFLGEFGKTFRVRDHLYVFLEGWDGQKIIFYDKDGKHLGELQGLGQQVVGAGSIHPSGEEYDLREDIDIITLSVDVFKSTFSDYIRKNDYTFSNEETPEDFEELIAETVPKWEEGQRQELALSLAGYLRKEKRLGFNSVKAIVEEVCKRAGDTEVNMRLNGVISTFKKDEKDVKGATGLKEVVPNSLNQGDYTLIWDDDKILKEKYFPSDKLGDSIYFGIQIPMMVEETFGKGGKKTTVKKQKMFNHIILKNKLERVNDDFRRENNMDFRSLPHSLPKRWLLKDIKKYLDGTESVDGKKLLDRITNKYEYYVHMLNPKWYKLLALWDIGSYAHMGFSAYPFIEHRGIAGTGKTKAMVVSSFISFNGSEIMVNPTESTLFREKEEVRGTTYFDEAEKLWVFNKATKQMEGDTRTELINSSYSKAGKVPRQEKIGNKFVTKWYSPYGPTQLASINGLYGATETRCITRITTKSPNDDPRGEREPEDDRNLSVWNEIRDECYRFILDNWNEIEELYLNYPKDCGLKRRDLQLWRPILSIAKFIDKETHDEMLEFAKEMSQRDLDDLIPETSFDYAILNALRTCVMEETSEKVYINAIKVRYCEQESKTEDLGNKYLNRNISNHLDKLGFKELRGRDNRASYFSVDLSTFNQIVTPVCPELTILSTLSTLSTPLQVNNNNNRVDSKVMSGDGNSEKVVNVVISGENVDDRGVELDNKKPDVEVVKVE